MATTEERKLAHRYGILAEQLAALYLMLKGYRVVAGRHRNVLGEIDLLARRGDMLVAVEVKARRSFAQCEESVPPWKQEKIARAVEGVLAGYGTGKIAGLARSHIHNVRFDVIWMVPWRWPRHIKDAWRP